MITPSPAKDKGHARRLLVTLVIATAGAAVAAGVVLKNHPPSQGVQRVDLSAVRAGAIAAAVPDDGATRSDPSLPSAAGVLEHAFGDSDQPATF
jgi:hypothetical protein